MTKKDALLIALSTLTATSYPNPNYDGTNDKIRKDIPADEVRETLNKMVEQLSKTREMSDEKKAELSAARKEKTAAARAALIAQVAPAIREVMNGDMTAAEIYEAAKDNLPDDMTARRVGEVLLHEMAPEVIKTERKSKPNLYRLIKEEA